ncbi:Contactin-1, partial [Ophiophagus hannah]
MFSTDLMAIFQGPANAFGVGRFIGKMIVTGCAMFTGAVAATVQGADPLVLAPKIVSSCTTSLEKQLCPERILLQPGGHLAPSQVHHRSPTFSVPQVDSFYPASSASRACAGVTRPIMLVALKMAIFLQAAAAGPPVMWLPCHLCCLFAAPAQSQSKPFHLELCPEHLSERMWAAGSRAPRRLSSNCYSWEALLVVGMVAVNCLKLLIPAQLSQLDLLVTFNHKASKNSGKSTKKGNGRLAQEKASFSMKEFITLDKRRYVSQTNGNLYIAKVEPTDKGNYSCCVTSNSITKSVFSSFISLIPQADRSKGYVPDIRVKFKDTYALLGQNVTLECFALGNPVPELRWSKYLEPKPSSADISMSGAVLKIFNIQFEDEGIYECEAENYRGKDKHSAKVYVQAHPEWVEHINDTERDIGSEFHWPCIATGKPIPTIRWLRNGLPYWKGELRFSSLKLEDSGMYQCVAENIHGMIYSNAELKVIVLPPTFEFYPMKKEVLAAKGGQAIIECKPKAAPKPKITWSKGTEILRNSTRIRIWYDGSLEIINVTAVDAGNYTCFVENNKGKANSSSALIITAATRITLAPTNVDVTVGLNATMQCLASHDPSLDLTFIWLLNGYPVNVDKESDYYERSIMIKDNGPPGPPGGLKVEDIKNTSVILTWSRGIENHSPISNYTIQSRTFLSEYWKDMKTDPSIVDGNAESAKVIDLIPWMEYEFRIMATNILGTGDPSIPSQKIRTEGSPPNVAPSEVGGGGGSNRELTITWV